MVINREKLLDLITLGVAVGATAAITWAIAKSKFEAEVQQQVSEVKAYYKKQYEMDKLKSDLEGKVYEAEDEVDVEMEVEVQVKETLEEYGARQFTGTPRLDALREDAVRLQSLAVEKANEELHPLSRPAIQIISGAEFHDDHDDDYPNQEKATVIFYEGDKVVVDQFDEKMEHYEALLGDFSDSFDSDVEGATTYVRNVPLKIDFEIELVKGSYEQEVLGLEPPLPEARRPMSYRDRG